MKSLKYIFFAIIGSLLLIVACEDAGFLNLKRDNPLDEKNDVDGVDGRWAQVAYDSHTVVSDNNTDNIINKGETIYLFVNLRNNGTGAANKVKAIFSTTSLHVSGFAPTVQIDYGDIPAGNTQHYGNGAYGYTDYGGENYTIKFTVLNTTPDNTKIPINISIVDENNNIWTDSFEVTVERTGAQIGYDSHTIVSDNNNDDIINKGETIYLFVNLKNNGSSTANKVEATFSTTSSYVSGFAPTVQVDYGDIPAGSKQLYGYGGYEYTGYGGEVYNVKFTVLNTTPDNTKIPIDISITDENGNIWTAGFEVTVEETVEETKAQIVYDSHTVVSDNNNDNIINKGETVYLFVNLKNNGSSTANKVEATFSTTSSYISGFTPTTQIDYGDIPAGNKQSYGYGAYGYTPYYNDYTVKFTVSNTTPSNTVIPVNISIVDESNSTWSSNFNVTVQN
jgi:uncharacterized Zn ribbon protein